MRVLVTGHAGYIGSVMVEKLLQRGYAVRGLDTCYYTDCALWESQGPTEAVTKDVRDVEPDDLDGIDAVIHLAALSNDPTGELDPKLTLEINCHATVRLATLAKAKGVRRFLFASSGGPGATFS